MNFKKAIGLGILAWLIMFAFVSAVLGLYQQYGWMKIVIVLVGGVLSYILAGFVTIPNAKTALSYGAIWLLAGLILDAIITRQFEANIFFQWSLWLGYALLMIAPLLRIRGSKQA